MTLPKPGARIGPAAREGPAPAPAAPAAAHAGPAGGEGVGEGEGDGFADRATAPAAAAAAGVGEGCTVEAAGLPPLPVAVGSWALGALLLSVGAGDAGI